MIRRNCTTCLRRTSQTRSQWAEVDDGRPVIYSEYTCTTCGTVHSHSRRFATDEQKADRT